MPRSLTYDAAAQLLKRPGYTLVKTFVATKRGVEFSIISTNGGPSGLITETTATRLMTDCRPCDPGLFADVAQTFSFHQKSSRKRNPPPRGLKT